MFSFLENILKRLHPFNLDFSIIFLLLTLFAMGVGAHRIRGIFFFLLWEHQGSWESEIFREFLKFIKVFGLKKSFLKKYLVSKALFVLKIFKFLSWLFWPGKRLDKRANVNFKIGHVIYLETNNYNTHIAQYRKK